MIQIINTTGKLEGVNRYVIKINNIVITYFDHKYEDGLSVCLNKASKAVKAQDKFKYQLCVWDNKKIK